MTGEKFAELLHDSLEAVTEKMRAHNGVYRTMRSKLKFERWFQIELLNALINSCEIFDDCIVFSEKEVDFKTSKKGKCIDLVIMKNNKKFIGIELKIIPTNYALEGFANKTKAITSSVDEFISDLDKPTDDGYEISYSISLIFPFNQNPNHRNNKLDFPKQLEKMQKKGVLNCLECNCNDDFISRFYILSNTEHLTDYLNT